MKILFLTDNFLPHWGGSRVYYYNICKNLPPESIVVLTNKTGEWKEFDKEQNFKIYRKKFNLFRSRYSQLNELWTLLLMLIYGFFLCMKEKPNIIHCGEIISTSLAGFILGKIFKIPYIVYSHSEDTGYLKKLRNERRLGVFLLRMTRLIIVSCESVKRELVKLVVKEEKIFKVTPGIDEEFLKEINPEELIALKRQKGLLGKKVILTVGRLIERKNHKMVIEALKEIVKKIPEVLYTIVGEGPERDTLERLVEYFELGDYVRFEGKITSVELLKYYASCDIFVMASKELESGDIEGFGIVFLEANAFGKPVIGPNIGGPRDAVIDKVTGLQVNPYDEKAIAEAIITLLNDEDYAKRLGEAGRQRVRNEFRWQDRADTIYQISQRIAKGLSE